MRLGDFLKKNFKHFETSSCLQESYRNNSKNCCILFTQIPSQLTFNHMYFIVVYVYVCV